MLRRMRLKKVFEGRKAQLETVRAHSAMHWPPDRKSERAYARAIKKYTRARCAWRAFRGWS